MTASAKTLRDPADLAAAGLLLPGRVDALRRVAERYAVAVTPVMAELIDPDDPADPIARQFLPAEAELDVAPEERADPIGDDLHQPVPRIVHRYPDRALLKLTHVCAVYCRFCFRRESVGPGAAATASLSAPELEAAVAYVAGDPRIWEVIVTGGDPLVLSPRRLADAAGRVAAIAHVRVLRWHSRVPVVAPERITPDLVAAIRPPGVTTYLAVHVNHPRELTADARAALNRLADAGIPLLAQTVLLKGVNDDPAVLEALMRALVECRVKPYYLHQGDLAPGTAHLRTTIEAGQALMRDLRGRVSGLCQPTYVLDIPGGHGKVPIGPAYLSGEGGDRRVEDPCGCRHAYPPPAEPPPVETP